MAGGDAGDKTEKPTPKRREEARKKGQVAKSMDVNGAAVFMASLMVMASMAPKIVETMGGVMRHTLQTIATPEVVTKDGLGPLVAANTKAFIACVAPIAAVCAVAGVIASLAQVGFNKPSWQVIKPTPQKINPWNGAKRVFGPTAIFETGKQLLKLTAIGAVTAIALIPQFDELAAMVGMPTADLLPHVAHMVLDIMKYSGLAYLVIAAIDYGYTKWKHEKDLKMSKEEIRQESKGQDVAPEVKGAIRRRQMEEARKRMMDDVPTADVVVTNPTHFAVALKYDGESPAPKVIAKGQDLIAFQIRKIAKEHGVPVIEDKPLARGLFAAVDVGHMIPEEFFQAVAQLLAFVYRVAGRQIV